jgi:hypothetical protein
MRRNQAAFSPSPPRRDDPDSPEFLQRSERNFTFREMSIFEGLRKWHEDKCNRSRVRLACFLLVCRLESVDWCSAGLPRRGDFLSIIEEAMSITPIIFLLVILLFGFDSAGQVNTRRQHNHG